MSRRAASIALLTLSMLSALPAGARAASPWAAVSHAAAAARGGSAPVETAPEHFRASVLDKAALRDALATTPAVISVPTPEGGLERFRVDASPVLAPALARRFPEIKTYAGESLDHPGDTGRFDLGPLGFHASVRSERGVWYVDPYYKGAADEVHVAYYRADLATPRSPLVAPGATDQLGEVVRRVAGRAPGTAVTRRVYRLALANDPSYSQYFGTDDLKVETAKAALMNRVNQLYNDDLAIRMELVANDYLLNFKTAEAYAAAGYGTQSCDSDLLDSNQNAIDTIIGPANYDIGHIVKRSGGGGIAALESVGQDGSKAQGCTGVDPPVGDGFAIDYVAHEMGHQFGGPHTFDGNGGSCMPPNRDLVGTVAVEPGSGSSIQAYAGICDTDDLQPNSDPYFSQSSIDSIQAYVTSDIAGATEEGTPSTVANHNPTVTAPAPKTIPVRTPFTLTGTATDPDAGDSLVYLWEQNDADFPNPIGTPLFSPPLSKANGPLFRVFGTAATEDKLQSPAPGQNVAKRADRTRTFPDPAQIAADDTDAETGLCPTTDVDCNSEVLPTQLYAPGVLNFRLTARDRSPVGGGVDHADVALTLDPTAGPFAVTGPTGPGPLVGNSMVDVTWDVANTAAGSVDAPFVRISYSTDGGLTFNYAVIDSTANDGSQSVVVPNLATTKGRFKVEAVDNYFFDVSDGDLTVAAGVGATPTATPGPEAEPSPAPTVQPLTVPQASSTTTPSGTAAATVSPGPTATATPGPSATTTPGPTAARGRVRPGLGHTGRRIRVRGHRRVRVLVGCRAVGTAGLPKRCSVYLRARVTGLRRVAHKRFSVGVGTTRVVTLRLRKDAVRRLRAKGRLTATLKATADGSTATKKVTLRR